MSVAAILTITTISISLGLFVSILTRLDRRRRELAKPMPEIEQDQETPGSSERGTITR